MNDLNKAINDLENFPLTELQQSLVNYLRANQDDIADTLGLDQSEGVCPDCGLNTLKTVVADRADLSFGEMTECSNKECPSHE